MQHQQGCHHLGMHGVLFCALQTCMGGTEWAALCMHSGCAAMQHAAGLPITLRSHMSALGSPPATLTLRSAKSPSIEKSESVTTRARV